MTSVLLFGLGLLMLSFLVQLVVWHVALPKRQTPELIVIFALVPLVVLGSAWASGHLPSLSASDVASLVLLYVACSLAYFVLYSAIEMESPALAIVSYLARAGAAGRTGSDVFDRFGRDDAMRSRVALMEQGGWVYREADLLSLSPQGRFYAKLFDCASTIVGLGLTKGG